MEIYFEWTNDISVGNVDIDNQHQKLLLQINIILNDIIKGVDVKEVESAIGFLDSYIKEHFSYEEDYMKKINYPHLNDHIKMHQEFITKYYEFKKEFNKGEKKEKIISDIESYIGEWWINHIGKEDKKYYLFFEEQKKK